MLWATFTPDDSRSGVKVEGIGDVCKDMLDKPVYAMGFAAHTQKEQDDARTPLTDEVEAL